MKTSMTACPLATTRGFLAVFTKTAANIEKQANDVSDFDAVDTGPDFNHLAKVFVT
jgi:hypothetical protein